MTYSSAGYYSIEINVRNNDEDVPLDQINHLALVNQLRDFADAIDPHEPEPFDGEIRYQKGTDQLDEIILDNVNVHIEQMDTDVYWMCFTKHGDRTHKRLAVNISTRDDVKRRVPLNGYVIENDRSIKEIR